MWLLFSVIAILWALATSAAADEMGRPDGRHGRAFWLNSQAWPNPPNPPDEPATASPPKPRFTMTYTDGVASRLHHSEGGGLFSQKLGGVGAPALVGTVDHGAALLVLRWRSGE
jgi:hypothetical protein